MRHGNDEDVFAPEHVEKGEGILIKQDASRAVVS
jgi:hypothetical protein